MPAYCSASILRPWGFASLEDESTKHLEAEGTDTVNFTGVKQQQSQSEPIRSAFPWLKLTTFAPE